MIYFTSQDNIPPVDFGLSAPAYTGQNWIIQNSDLVSGVYGIAGGSLRDSSGRLYGFSQSSQQIGYQSSDDQFSYLHIIDVNDGDSFDLVIRLNPTVTVQKGGTKTTAYAPQFYSLTHNSAVAAAPVTAYTPGSRGSGGVDATTVPAQTTSADIPAVPDQQLPKEASPGSDVATVVAVLPPGPGIEAYSVVRYQGQYFPMYQDWTGNTVYVLPDTADVVHLANVRGLSYVYTVGRAFSDIWRGVPNIAPWLSAWIATGETVKPSGSIAAPFQNSFPPLDPGFAYVLLSGEGLLDGPNKTPLDFTAGDSAGVQTGVVVGPNTSGTFSTVPPGTPAIQIPNGGAIPIAASEQNDRWEFTFHLIAGPGTSILGPDPLSNYYVFAYRNLSKNGPLSTYSWSVNTRGIDLTKLNIGQIGEITAAVVVAAAVAVLTAGAGAALAPGIIGATVASVATTAAIAGGVTEAVFATTAIAGGASFGSVLVQSVITGVETGVAVDAAAALSTALSTPTLSSNTPTAGIDDVTQGTSVAVPQETVTAGVDDVVTSTGVTPTDVAAGATSETVSTLDKTETFLKAAAKAIEQQTTKIAVTVGTGFVATKIKNAIDPVNLPSAPTVPTNVPGSGTVNTAIKNATANVPTSISKGALAALAALGAIIVAKK